MKFICVGGAPVSGVEQLLTVLGDQPNVASSVGLSVFSSGSFYSFDDEFKRSSINQIPVQSECCYIDRIKFLNRGQVLKDGISSKDIDKLIVDSSSPKEFAVGLANKCVSQSLSSIDVFAEGTPDNVNQAASFCNVFSEGIFVHVVRHPKTAIPELVSCGFTLVEAVIIWMYQNWIGSLAESFDNYRRVKYEDIERDPRGVLLSLGCGNESGGTVSSSNEKNQNQVSERLSSVAWKMVQNIELVIAGDINEVKTVVSLSDLCSKLGYSDVSQVDPADPVAQEDFFEVQMKDYYERAKLVHKQRVFELRLSSSSRIEDRYVSGLRVLQGVTGQAGQPKAIAKALRDRGHYSHSCSVVQHAFDYGYELGVTIPKNRALGPSIATLSSLANHYDVFHFHARTFLTSYYELSYPSLLDLVWLKSIGKKVFFHFRGSEIRLKDHFDANNPFHFKEGEEDALKIFAKIPVEVKLHLRDLIRCVADGVLVTDVEIQSYVGEDSIVVPRTVDASIVENVGAVRKEKPLVVHAPSRRGIKGTEHVIQAVEKLRENGVEFDFRLVEGLKNEEAIALYRDADVIVDQLRLGWYGVLSVEAMALGKPVVCYLREDLVEKSQDQIPIVNANPDTVYDALKDLIVNPSKRVSIGQDSFEYFKAVHSPEAVVSKLESVYTLCEREPKDIDWARVGHMLDFQAQQFQGVQVMELNRQIGRLNSKMEKYKRKSIKIPGFLRPLKNLYK